MSTNPFVSLFGRSPIGPMQAHFNKVYDCARLLITFFEAVMQNDWQLAGKIQQDMVWLEHEADVLKREVRQHLPKGLFLPVPRSDLLDLLSVQDKVANRAKDISGLMLGRTMSIPPQLQEIMRSYVECTVAACTQAWEAINELDELLGTGFKGRVAALVETMVEKLDGIENDSDRLQVEVRRGLFNIERELPPVDVIFLYQIIEWIGDVADRAQRVGNRLEQLLAL